MSHILLAYLLNSWGEDCLNKWEILSKVIVKGKQMLLELKGKNSFFFLDELCTVPAKIGT